MARLEKGICNGDYIVYSDGTVYSCKSKKFLRPLNNGNGYLAVSICVKGREKRMYIHRLVAEAFLDNPDGLPEINHKDENRGNNNLENLEWCTPKYNKNYGNRALKFSKKRGKPVKCVETGIVYHGIREAERQTGIRASSICACCSGYRGTLTAGGFHWIFA